MNKRMPMKSQTNGNEPRNTMSVDADQTLDPVTPMPKVADARTKRSVGGTGKSLPMRRSGGSSY
jgi:hypothetical protein